MSKQQQSELKNLVWHILLCCVALIGITVLELFPSGVWEAVIIKHVGHIFVALYIVRSVLKTIGGWRKKT